MTRLEQLSRKKDQHPKREPRTCTSGSKPKNGSKLKLEETVLLAPEGLRVFDGLAIFFVPNNDISAVRRIRIKKAIEYGGSWVRDWNANIKLDFIIVDNGVPFQDVLRFTNLSRLPEGTIAVNETWLPECISNNCLVDASAACFRVSGFELLDIPQKDPSALSDATSKSDAACEFVIGQDSILESGRGDEERPSREDYNPSLESIEPLHPKEGGLSQAVSSSNDPLENLIVQVKATAHLPLDSDNECAHEGPGKKNEASSSESSEHSPPTSKGKRKAFPGDKVLRQSKFQCMHPHGSSEDAAGPNQRTIDILQQMHEYYVSVQDTWRSRAYRMAIATLRKQSKQIRTKQEAASLPSIGDRLAEKIEEIVRTNRLLRLENARLDPEDKALKLFMSIYGVGFSQAAKWVQDGLRSLQDLEQNVNLTPNQRLGLEHYEDLRLRIPRDEVEQLGTITRTALREIDSECELIIGGSYRRGSKDSGDIDLMITKPNTSLRELRRIVLETLIPKLEAQGFLVAALAVTNRETGSKWHGLCQLPVDIGQDRSKDKINPNPRRRVDFLLVPFDEIGAAKLYFTGNDIFNRSMRLLARTKGMSLNQKGLYQNVIRKRGVKLTTGTKIEGEDERRIFERLGVPWREPWERNI